MSDSVRPHSRQPTRLPRPWDFPGKNTGVGCHFLLQCMKVKNESEVAQSRPTLQPHGLQYTRLLCPWDFPGKSTGVGCHCLLQFNQAIHTLNVLYICQNHQSGWGEAGKGILGQRLYAVRYCKYLWGGVPSRGNSKC